MKANIFAANETFQRKKKLIYNMGKTSKLTIGVSVASGILLATWLLTGTRKEKTKKIISMGSATLTKTLKKDTRRGYDDLDGYYI